MVQFGGHLGFEGESSQSPWRRRFRIHDHLERHRAAQTDLHGFVNNTHPAAAERLAQFVITKAPVARAGINLAGREIVRFNVEAPRAESPQGVQGSFGTAFVTGLQGSASSTVHLSLLTLDRLAW